MIFLVHFIQAKYIFISILMWPSLLIRTCIWYFLDSAVRLWQESHLWKKSDVSLLCTTELAAAIIHRFYKRLLEKLGVVILQKKWRLRAVKFSSESALKRQSWEWDTSPTLSQLRYLHGRMSLLTSKFSLWIHLRWEVLKDKDRGLYWDVSTQSKERRGMDLS